MGLKAQTAEECHDMIVEGIEEMNNKNHAHSLEILLKAKNIAEEKNWPRHQFLAINNIGANYYLMLDYGEALDNYLEAYKIALKDLEPNYEMIVLNNIAILYSKEKRFDKAEEYFLKAYEIASETKDSLKISLYSINLATVANEKNQVKKAENYLDISFRHLRKSPSLRIQALITKAQNLVLKNQFVEAENIVDSILPKLQTPDLSEQRISTYMLLVSIYKKQNRFEPAIEYINLALEDAQSSIETKIDAFDKLSQLYRSLGNMDRAFLYKDSLILAKDSLNQVKNGKLFENSRIKFELQNYQNELSQSQEKLKAERKTFYMIIGGIISLIIITLWAVRNYYVKLEQRKIIAENNQKITELELEKEKQDKLILKQELNEQSVAAQLEKERFKNEIEAKNRKLTSKALLVSTRNELIENIIDSLSQESEVRTNESLKKRIFELKNHLKKESEWDDFFTHFEEVNQGFLKSLKENHPTLTANDIRFLSYVYMNLSSKEISSVLNITVEACRKRKERIIKKMNLSDDVDLYSYISAL